MLSIVKWKIQNILFSKRSPLASIKSSTVFTVIDDILHDIHNNLLQACHGLHFGLFRE